MQFADNPQMFALQRNQGAARAETDFADLSVSAAVGMGAEKQVALLKTKPFQQRFDNAFEIEEIELLCAVVSLDMRQACLIQTAGAVQRDAQPPYLVGQRQFTHRRAAAPIASFLRAVCSSDLKDGQAFGVTLVVGQISNALTIRFRRITRRSGESGFVSSMKGFVRLAPLAFRVRYLLVAARSRLKGWRGFPVLTAYG